MPPEGLQPYSVIQQPGGTYSAPDGGAANFANSILQGGFDDVMKQAQAEQLARQSASPQMMQKPQAPVMGKQTGGPPQRGNMPNGGQRQHGFRWHGKAHQRPQR
jgi:hypothetical protein